MCECVKECKPKSDELYALKIPRGAYYTVRLLKNGTQMLVVKKPPLVKSGVDENA